jgi:hypothetical protein
VAGRRIHRLWPDVWQSRGLVHLRGREPDRPDTGRHGGEGGSADRHCDTWRTRNRVGIRGPARDQPGAGDAVQRSARWHPDARRQRPSPASSSNWARSRCSHQGRGRTDLIDGVTPETGCSTRRTARASLDAALPTDARGSAPAMDSPQRAGSQHDQCDTRSHSPAQRSDAAGLLG